MNNKKQTIQICIINFISSQGTTRTRTIGENLEMNTNKTASPKPRQKLTSKQNSNKKKKQQL